MGGGAPDRTDSGIVPVQLTELRLLPFKLIREGCSSSTLGPFKFSRHGSRAGDSDFKMRESHGPGPRRKAYPSCEEFRMMRSHFD